MPRFDEMPEYVAKLPKSSHDLSHDFKFTATVAHLLPVFHTILSPGDKVRLGVKFDLRTMPMQSAAFLHLRTHVEYFFVPLQLLYQPFGSMFFAINDQFSSQFPNNVRNGVQADFPVLDFDDVITQLNTDKAVSYLGESKGQSAYRLFDMLGYNPIAIVDTTAYPTTGAGWNPNVFPYPILAYNCIYQYYYRLDTRELFDQHSFNWDQFYNTALVDRTGYNPDYCLLKCRPMQDDYFTNVKVSPIVDVLNINGRPQNLSLAEQWITRSSIGSTTILSNGSVGNSSGYSSSPTYGSNTNANSFIQTQFGFRSIAGQSSVDTYNGLDITTANIRALFANEKLWSVTGRARKHYDDQVLAHFGVHVPHDVKHEISCFGHDRSEIGIGEVFNTADTFNPQTLTGVPLGEIAGKGYGHQNFDYHTFTAPVHGVVMAIFSVVPDYSYVNTYPKYNVLTDRQSLPIPEYDHLGMQPLFDYEADIRNASSSGTDIDGWQYRYEQWKRRYNRVTQAFNGNRPYQGTLDSWAMSIIPYRGVGSNSPNTNQYVNFLALPTDLNQVMLGVYSSSWVTAFTQNGGVAIYNNDPFVVSMQIDCKLTSWMSDYSLPRLDA